ncbi:MAG: hypothetical protein NC412_10440 [Roseburia sp.]|nr:hypothetical protein [Roseburia sp.]MCM1279189.1 hypothetical protein [Robinsoniella sp.]
MKRPTCFFCYSWEENDDYEILDFLKKKIETESKIKVTLDRYSYSYNSNIREKIEEIEKHNMVVIYLTPELKSILLSPKTNRERIIQKEYEKVQEMYEINPSSVFPVILRGNRETSVFSPYEDNICPSIMKFISKKQTAKSPQYCIDKNNRAAYQKFIDDLVGQTLFNFNTSLPEYASTLETVQKLFWLKNTEELPESCLVKSQIYIYIMAQKYYFVAGRKGAGKSTFITNFKGIDILGFNKHYKQMIPIKAEAFQHEHAYTELILRNSHDTDVIEPYQILNIFWQVYFVLQTILTIGIEIDDHHIKRSDVRYSSFQRVVNKLKTMLNLKDSTRRKYLSFKIDSVPRALFTLAVDEVANQFSYSIDQANPESLYASFNVNMRADLILERMFSKAGLSKFAEALDRCDKKILISVDGFDMRSEYFRESTQKMNRDSLEYRMRTIYEQEFYMSLVDVVCKYKQNEYDSPIMSTFGEYMDFCIVLPRDRYDQIIMSDRDSAKKNFCSLTWDAFELLELCVKRLEYLILKIDSDVIIDKNLDYYQRWENALDFFPQLPKIVYMNVRGNVVGMSLFNYILRCSLWRPRDLITILSNLLSYVIETDSKQDIKFIGSKKEFSQEMFKRCIKHSSTDILNKEVIGEYKNVFRNLEAVLLKFLDCDILQETSMFLEKLAKIKFDALFVYKMDEVKNKLLVLYQLGLIGLYYDQTVAETHHYVHHICFVFNAGLSPLNDFNNDDYTTSRAKIIFNPILCDKLRLKFNTTELLCNWTKNEIDCFHNGKMEIQDL